ncbi:hypothetical protein J3E74DRAFT_307522 [Bipolaris maydis]|nr:hypothetical protein J3E74DRAFT_307522 [Bipolaris maydis]
MALDSLASELDALRTHWETTNKAYRLSDRFDFERTPTNDKTTLNESLSQWRNNVDMDDSDDDDDSIKDVKGVSDAKDVKDAKPMKSTSPVTPSAPQTH